MKDTYVLCPVSVIIGDTGPITKEVKVIEVTSLRELLNVDEILDEASETPPLDGNMNTASCRQEFKTRFGGKISRRGKANSSGDKTIMVMALAPSAVRGIVPPTFGTTRLNHINVEVINSYFVFFLVEFFIVEVIKSYFVFFLVVKVFNIGYYVILIFLENF